jgi:hypothetical protein
MEVSFRFSFIVVQDIPHSRRLYDDILHLKVTEDYGTYNVGYEGGLSIYGKDFFQEISQLTSVPQDQISREVEDQK